jgi:virginiamycin B lyase
MRIRPATAELTFDLADASPRYVAIGVMGTLWVSCSASHEIAELHSDGAIVHHWVEASPHQIAINGSDVWFTMPSIDSVGRIDRRGRIRTHALPRGSAPTGIAADADGAWVTLRGTGELASVSNRGVVDVMSTGIDYDNPTLLAMRGTPSHIAIDHTDRSLWFTLTGLAEVGHRFQRGSASYWSDLDCIEPTGIAVDPGSIWITDFAGAGIWRVDRPSGALERVAVWPSGASVAIAADGLGGCWFSEIDEDLVAHCSRDGAMTQYDVSPYGHRPRGIAVDQRGVAWVALATGGIVGVIGRPAA